MTRVADRLHELTVEGRPWPLPAHPRRGAALVAACGGATAERWPVLRDVLQPRPKARGIPFEYVIEVTSRCNLACPMCPREVATDLANRDMEMDTFLRVLDRIRDAASFIWLAGLGEPMMNRHFMNMIAACQRAGIATGASTNGTFLTATWQERLLASGLDLLIVSFDGTTRESYEKVRVGAHFEKVRDQVRELAQRKAARGAPKPWLILQMLELSHTAGQAEDFHRMWDIPGVDAVRVKKDELQFDESLAVEGQRKRTGRRPCPFLWRGTVYVHWDGHISPCCYGDHDQSFGNLKDTPIQALWNSLRLQQLRRSHLEGCGLREPFCRHCNTFQPGKLSMAASVLVPSLLQKKHAGLVERLNRRVRFME